MYWLCIRYTLGSEGLTFLFLQRAQAQAEKAAEQVKGWMFMRHNCESFHIFFTFCFLISKGKKIPSAKSENSAWIDVYINRVLSWSKKNHKIDLIRLKTRLVISNLGTYLHSRFLKAFCWSTLKINLPSSFASGTLWIPRMYGGTQLYLDGPVRGYSDTNDSY